MLNLCMAKFFASIIMFIIFLTCSNPLSASSANIGDPLRDIFIDVSELGTSIHVRNFCIRLGRTLTKSPAFGNAGTWARYRCKSSSNVKVTWNLKVVLGENDDLVFTLSNRDENQYFSPQTWNEADLIYAKFTADELDLWFKYLQLRVAARSPSLARTSGKRIDSFELDEKVRINLNLPAKISSEIRKKVKEDLIPSTIYAYKLVVGPDGFLGPELLFDAKIDPSDVSVKKDVKKGSKKNDGKPVETLTYTITKVHSANKLNQKDVVFIHSEKGPGYLKLDEEWTSQVLAAPRQSLISRLINRVQVGMRFGFGQAKTPIVLQKTRLASLLVESKSGFTKGLKTYYDVIPRAKYTDRAGALSSFYSSRFSVGWSIITPVDQLTNGIIRSVDVTPKFGTWTFDASVPVEFDDGSFESLSFETKRSYALGWDLSLEFGGLGLSGRFWYGGDFTGLLGQRLGETKINQHRYGVDLFMPFVDFGDPKSPLSINLIVFGYLESISLEKVNEASMDDESQSLSNLAYKNAFIGTGVTIAF